MVNNIESTVISTRVRLARNLVGYPFPNRIRDVSQAKEIIRKVNDVASDIREFTLYSMDVISENVAQAIFDDHLISAELVANKEYGAALIDEREQEKDEPHERVSIMINEEDHLREQYITDGLNLPQAYRKISEIDDELSKSLRFAYDDRLGYLTACPTNLGTGLRASVMLFLPGLTKMRKMNSVIREIAKLGHTVRGVYGEGSRAEGFMYQISNEVTLGEEEECILSEVQKAVLNIVNLESQARKSLRAGDCDGLRDLCWRARGVLTNCYKISFEDFLRRVSEVKLGIALGFLSIEKFSFIDELIAAVRPANIALEFDGLLTPAERDIRRAALCRAALKDCVLTDEENLE